MLTISPTALDALRDYSRPAFVARTYRGLADAHPHFLPRFPEAFGHAIVANMLGRASAWGLTGQRGLSVWCEWMIVVAPDFDEEPEIRAQLERSGAALDRAAIDLPRLVSTAAWGRAERDASNLPLFAHPATAGLPLIERTAQAIPLVLYDRPAAADGSRAAHVGAAAAERLGLGAVRDAALVMAACHAFWDEGFTELPWARELVQERWSPPAFVAALRLRIALEFGRFV